MSVIDPMKLLYDEPWVFATGDFVTDGAAHFRIVSHAIDKATGTPVYVYQGFGGDESFVRWTRPRTEMEDGRFTRTHACDMSEVPQDDPLRAEHAELIEALEGMLCQHTEYNGELDSGCLSANSHAIRLLARIGRVRLTGDGPGRNVSGVLVEAKDSSGGDNA